MCEELCCAASVGVVVLVQQPWRHIFCVLCALSRAIGVAAVILQQQAG